MKSFSSGLYFILILLISNTTFAQTPPPATKIAGIPVNYDESLVGNYTLPDPFLLNNGKKVTGTQDWEKVRRPQIVKLFEDNQFGKVPAKPAAMWFNVFDKGTPVFGGKAIRKQVTIYFTKDTSDHKMDLLIYLPVQSVKPVPLLMGISFSANSLVVDDPGVKKGMVWGRDGKKVPAPATGGFGKINVEKFIDNGIGYATVYYGDIEPDSKTGLPNGVRGLYLKPGATQVEPGEWGAIAAWTWGLSRAMDYFETDKDIDSKKIAVTGASRLGKTVLWAGARDPRFAMVIASVSGESGAALSRRNYGETVAHMTDTSRFFYQFAPHYHDYSNRVNELPVDGHMLISLIAPRPLLLQTGDSDFWSDPKGEFLAAKAAEPVFQLYGKKVLEKDSLPSAGDDSMLNSLGYFMHKGGHGVLPGDYDIFIRYIQKHFGLKENK